MCHAQQGTYVGQAVAMLEDVLTRMEEHQSRKTAHLRALKSWQYLVPLTERGRPRPQQGPTTPDA